MKEILDVLTVNLSLRTDMICFMFLLKRVEKKARILEWIKNEMTVIFDVSSLLMSLLKFIIAVRNQYTNLVLTRNLESFLLYSLNCRMDISLLSRNESSSPFSVLQT